MEAKQRILIKILFFLLSASVVLASCGRNYMNFDFAEIIEGENFENISLTIYYAEPDLLIMFPWSLDEFKSIDDERIVNRIAISGSDLEEYIDLFKQINSDTLKRVRGRTPIAPDIRFYYVLESSVNGKLLDVVLWGGRSGAIFNGVEVEMHYIFYDIMIPFLPEDFAERMMRWRDELSYGSK